MKTVPDKNFIVLLFLAVLSVTAVEQKGKLGPQILKKPMEHKEVKNEFLRSFNLWHQSSLQHFYVSQAFLVLLPTSSTIISSVSIPIVTMFNTFIADQ